MSGNGGFQEKALQNRAAIAHISPTSNERMSVRTKTLDGRAIAVPPHQVAVLSEQPKVVFVNPQTAVPTCWAGSETYIDFQIPPELHILTNLVLRLPITVPTAVSGSPTSLPHTSYWVSRIEVQAGKDTIETLYPEQLDFHNTARSAINEATQDSVRLNYVDVLTAMASTAGVAGTVVAAGTPGSAPAASSVSGQTAGVAKTPYGLVGTIAAGDYDKGNCFYLPVPCSLTQGKVFVSGFVTPFRLRVFFPSAITTLSTAAIPVLKNNIQLYCYEQELSAINYEAKLREHRNGSVSYKIVLHDRYVESYPNLTQSGDFTIQLKAFKSLSAGLLLTWTPQAADQNNFNALTTTKQKIESLELLDNVGRRMTETLRDEWLRWFVWKTNFDTTFPTYQPCYVIPFSSDLDETLKNGVNLGYEQLTTLEQLRVIFPSDLPQNPASSGKYQYVMNITSFNYAMLECNAGVPRVVFT